VRGGSKKEAQTFAPAGHLKGDGDDDGEKKSKNKNKNKNKNKKKTRENGPIDGSGSSGGGSSGRISSRSIDKLEGFGSLILRFVDKIRSFISSKSRMGLGGSGSRRARSMTGSGAGGARSKTSRQLHTPPSSYSSFLGKDKGGGSGNARIQAEIRSFLANPPDNMSLQVGSSIRVWVVTLRGVEGTVFSGEKYRLKMVFPRDYPSRPPSVFFLKPTPKHVHVYSNGDICLNLLGKDWRPNMTAQTLSLSIQSMLSSAREKRLPPDNALHADSAPGQVQDNWMYHDDSC